MVRSVYVYNTLHYVVKVFCVYCRYASRHKLVTFATKGAEAFCVKRFDNYKKTLENFHIHDTTALHQEATMKFHSLHNPSVVVQVSNQAAEAQDVRCRGLLMQLQAMKFLLRQGIALRGHCETEGKLYLSSWLLG